MHTTVGFGQNASVTTEEYLAGIADQSHRVSGDDIYVGAYNRVVAAMAMGNSMSYGKLESPSLRRVFNPFIIPKCSQAADSKDAWQPQDMSRNPLVLATNEALNAKSKISEVHDGEWNIVGVNLAKGALTTVTGEIHTLKITGSETLTIGVWTNTSLTLGVDLPVGRYQLVGAECFANYGGLFRFVPIGEDFRPGGIMADDDFQSNLGCQRMGNWGVWCEFDQLTPPSLDICPYIAGTWYTITMDLIKVG